MRYILCILLSGCAATYAFTPASKEALDSKPRNCPVEAMAGEPTREYQDLGTLEQYSGTAPQGIDGFKRAIAKQVCEVGGDAAIGIADSSGRFTKGRVIKYVGGMAAPLKTVQTPVQQAMDGENPNL
jgi:hypothetical protein